MAGTVVIPWYATVFRGDSFEQALKEVAAVAQPEVPAVEVAETSGSNASVS